MAGVMRAVIDQDISPRERLTGQLPVAWAVAVGIPHLHEALAGGNFAFVTSRVDLSRAVFDAASDLEVVGKLGTGIDNVDVAAARDYGVDLTYTPGLNAISVAEHTLALVLATARRFTESRRRIESCGWRDDVTRGPQLSGKTLVTVGFGDVGKRFGTLLSGFDVELLVHDPYVPRIDAELVGGEMVALDRLLAASDVIVLTPELTDETQGLINGDAFDHIQDSADLVNTARGAIIDQPALLGALRNGKFAVAGLDVFEWEPPDAEAELLEFDEVLIRAATIDQLVENVLALVDGESIPALYLTTGA